MCNDRCDAVLAAMPGWEFTQLPCGFGWAPDRHFRAQLTNGQQQIRVVIRQCWDDEGLRRESLLYGSVFPRLPIRTPGLWSVVEIPVNDTRWMVLEDLGEGMIDSSLPEHRQAFMATLGALHGSTISNQELLSTIELPQFSPNDGLYLKWRQALVQALQNPQYELDEWMGTLFTQSLDRLAREPVVLLHGDTDWSNAIHVEGTTALIDWERAQIGPAALDLGRPAAAISTDEIAAYHQAFCRAAGIHFPIETIHRWVALGECVDCFRWISYYITACEAGDDPGDEWRRSYYLPCLDRLHRLYRC